MAKLQNVVIKFVGGHTRHPEIVGASLVDALCGGCPVWWMPCVVDALCGGCPISRQAGTRPAPTTGDNWGVGSGIM